VLSLAGGAELASFLAYPSGFGGGVSVACGDVDGDGLADIVTGAGPGGGPHVRAFALGGGSPTEVAGFLAFDPAFRGGVHVAVGDVTGDGVRDLVVGAGPGGGPHVRVFDGVTGAEVRSFVAYDPGFRGGVFVAAADLTGDGVADIITGAGPGGGPHVNVFDGATGALVSSFYAYQCDDPVAGPCFGGGVSVAAGDVTGDGRADLVTGAGPGGSPHVRVFDGVTGAEVRSFVAYDPAFTGGAFVAAGDVTGDGRADILTGAGPGGGPHVKVFDGVTGAEVASFLAYDPTFTGGVFVGTGN
jgi:hypothetical protein